MRLLPCGDRALLVEVASVEEAMALYAAVARAEGLGVGDVVPAARTVLFDGIGDEGRLRSFLDDVDLGAATPVAATPGRGAEPVVVPTRYDGPDLDDVARLWDMTRAEAVATHTGATFTVAFCGFAPGFPYCTGLPEAQAVPRLDRPRPRVPAGAVGVAGEFTGVYPRASPGGWRLLGRTHLRLWDPAADEPALLSPGALVRFVEVRE